MPKLPWRLILTIVAVMIVVNQVGARVEAIRDIVSPAPKA